MHNANGQANGNNETLEVKKKELLRNFLEPEAYHKMEYLKGTSPDKYNLIVSMVAQSASSGNLKYKITSEQIRNIIVNLEQRNEKKIEIRRK
jgi:DNA-binding TFAR19-related protein (PDSD5 family)